jgi:glutamyl-tRNA synthetase
VGIAPDETVGKNEKFGPYRQSERKHLYKEYADQLINSGYYYAFDTPEALDTFRKSEEEQGKHSYTIILTEKTRHFGNFYRRNG